MADLTKINEVITELEDQVEGIKQFGNIVDKINALSTETVKLSETVNQNAEQFSLLGNKLEIIIKDNDAMFVNMQNHLTERIDVFQNNTLTTHGNLTESLQKSIMQIESAIMKFKHSTEMRIDELKSDNRTFQRELESMLDSRIDKLRISIQTDTKSELEYVVNKASVQLDQSKNIFMKEIDIFKNEYNENIKQNKKISMFLIFLGLCILGAQIVVFFK